MSRISSVADWILRLPLVWGGLACLAFYSLIYSGWIDQPWVMRYFANHVVEQVETAMFFIGIAALVMRLVGVIGQIGVLDRPLIEPVMAGGQSTDDSQRLLDQLEANPPFMRNTYLVRRLHNALDYVRRKESADTLESHLEYLEAVDQDRMSQGYGLVRIVVWAIPILGFLGTVIGITMAIGNLDAQALEESMGLVTADLGVAFDTTTLALSLSIVLMVTKFVVESVEGKLLAGVDERVGRELIGRFHQYGAGTDPNVASMRRTCDEVVRAVDTMAARQAELWRTAIDETHSQWASVTSTAGDLLNEALRSGLKESLRDHADAITTGTATQVEALTAGADKHRQAIEAGVEKHREAIEVTVTKQIEALSRHVQEHAGAVDQGAKHLLGNLREGLERMAELLVEALQSHGETLTQAEKELASENRRHLMEVEAALGEAMVVAADRQEKLINQSEKLLKEMQESLTDAAGATVEHQQQLINQGEVLLKVVDATGQIKRLEESLNDNLSSLGRVHNFEETLLSLSAAIQLLSARVGNQSPTTERTSLSSQAA